MKAYLLLTEQQEWNVMELPKTDEDLIIACRFTCTLCPATDIQVHHIDGNHNNDVPENKTVLCQKHHDQAQKDIQLINCSKKGTKIQTATKLITPRILIKCRTNWLEKCSTIPPWIEEDRELKKQLKENQETIMKKVDMQQKEIEKIKRKVGVIP